MHEFTLEGKTIIITGSGSGIGRGAALTAAGLGARVAVLDRSRNDAAATVELIAGRGGRAGAVVADVSDENDMRRAFGDVVEEFGEFHGLVNNAGVLAANSVIDTSVEEWDRLMAVNARGVFIGCKLAVSHFLERGITGSIVNTASISAVVGMPEQAAYCASKGAVLQLTKQIAVDFSSRGVRCNSVGPGSVMTPVLQAYIDGQSDPSSALSTLEAGHPIGRIAAPEEIGRAMCFLLSDAASFITGANLQVDGGYSAA